MLYEERCDPQNQHRSTFLEGSKMKKIKAYIGLKIVSIGIKLFESQPFGLLDNEDKENLKKLWKYHDEFQKRLG